AKWRGRWPEWAIAEVFLQAPWRTSAQAWFTLLQALGDAAWGGDDPRPGEAKLGWWAEELQGWARGARRHPLGRLLAPRAASWPAWFARRRGLGAAAGGGDDRRPGEARLGWWAEELQGWARGARRHPLGRLLAPRAASWPALAAALPTLQASRARPRDSTAAVA